MRSRFFHIASGLSLMMFLGGCTQTNVSGTIQIQALSPVVGQHCAYEAKPVPFQTVTNTKNLRGLLGKVVTSSGVLTDEDIYDGNYADIHTQFSKTGSAYYAMDLGSLWAATFYHALETGYQLFKSISPKADMRTLAAGRGHSLADTLIFQEAKIESGDDFLVDNAAYLLFGDSQNIFINSPTEEISDIPLVFNMGIMVHEYTHMVTNYLMNLPIKERGASRSASTATGRTLRAIDEGMADYFGFLATSDPAFILCSIDRDYRNMSDLKYLNADAKKAISDGTGFSEHILGSFFAAAQWAMGERLGDHRAHALTVIELMERLGRGQCGTTLDFSRVANCHQGVTSRHSEISTVYQALGF